MKYYKGFNPDMTCRGFQYKEGETYETDKAKLCECGFHACENPLNVFNYYSPCNENGELNKFHEVELESVDDQNSNDTNDTKVVAKKITIGAELNFFGLAKAHVEWINNQVGSKTENENSTGYKSVATNTGDYSVATNTGDNSAATNTGNYSVATNTGDNSVATNTGDNSAATNTGNYSVATNTGDNSVATNTGDNSAATNTGNYSVATNTGDNSVATNTGNYSAATNTGDNSAATNTGDYSVATNTGKNSISLAWGIDSKAKAAKGSYIALSEWVYNGYEWVLKCAKMKKVDGKTIKADTFYMLIDGKFVEVE